VSPAAWGQHATPGRGRAAAAGRRPEREYYRRVSMRAEPSESESARRVIRAPLAIVWLVVAAALVLFLLVDLVIRGSWYAALLACPWLLLVLWLVYVLLFVPHVVADARGVRVHSGLRVTEFGWGAVTSVAVRWQLEFR